MAKDTPYMEILTEKGEKFLRGWARADAYYDPKGAARRVAQFNKTF